MIRLSSIKLCTLSIFMTFTPLERMALLFKSRESYYLAFNQGRQPSSQIPNDRGENWRIDTLSQVGCLLMEIKRGQTVIKSSVFWPVIQGFPTSVLWLINTRKPTKFQERIAHLYLSFPYVARISNTKCARSKSRKWWQSQRLENRFPLIIG